MGGDIFFSGDSYRRAGFAIPEAAMILS